jgi:chemotaxis protein methyltransferase CheR
MKGDRQAADEAVDEAADEAVDEVAVPRFLETVFIHYGYDLRAYAPASIRRRVLAAVAKSGLDSVDDLERRIVSDPRFAANVIEDLTVNVSEMFRDPAFFQAVRERLVPLLRTYPRLNIWSSGCATGEEAYSTAILLTEEGLYDRCQIYATDLNPRMVTHAKEGIYPATIIARFTDNYRRAGGTSLCSSYFTEAYGRIAMRETLRRNIVFFHHDLVGDHVFGEMHVIFCRYVFIYFGRDLQSRIAVKLAQSLRPGGFLGLGSSERLPAALRHQFGEFAPGERIYRFQLDSDPGPASAGGQHGR